MSMESRCQQYGKVFEHWQIRERIGLGSGGKTAVFRLVHSDARSVESALKVVNLTQTRCLPDEFSPSLKREYDAACETCKAQAEQEVLMMNALRGRTNIVDYLDHTFVNWEDGGFCGCDMLVRMELLRDLRSEINRRDLTGFQEAEILKIGKDICSALILCHSKHIIHRDIKPENIFFNEDGNYKLGDFGISRILSNAPLAHASTSVGTLQYLAPEQISGTYDSRVDIYSLGLVLYELSNGGLLPFASSRYVTDAEILPRLRGAALPDPRNASSVLAGVIRKACAYRPQDRYQTAQAFWNALNEASEGAAASAPVLPSEYVPPQRSAAFCGKCGARLDDKGRCTNPQCAVRKETPPAAPSQKGRGWFLLPLAVLLCLVLLIYGKSGGRKAAESQPIGITETWGNIGDVLEFGSYEQDGNQDNGPEPIRWKILEIKDNRCFLLSENAMDCMQYSTQYEDTTWEKSSLRRWLNSNFYVSAFTPSEQKKILTTAVTADLNPSYGTNPGEDTEDKVFLLSVPEVLKYFPQDDQRVCLPTAYTANQGAYIDKVTGGSWWWLRTPGSSSKDAASISGDGSINFSDGSVISSTGTIRPAMWIRMN